MRDRYALPAAIALLAVALLLGSVAIAHGIRDRNTNDVITVTGSAKKRISSDYDTSTLRKDISAVVNVTFALR